MSKTFYAIENEALKGLEYSRINGITKEGGIGRYNSLTGKTDIAYYIKYKPRKQGTRIVLKNSLIPSHILHKIESLGFIPNKQQPKYEIEIFIDDNTDKDTLDTVLDILQQVKEQFIKEVM